ncbi:MAG TPA: hypothetical protein VGM59_06940 [Dongiaceae bacterium]
MTLSALGSSSTPFTVNGYMTTVAATPIPATGLMLLTALGVLGFLVVRHKRSGAVFGNAAA